MEYFKKGFLNATKEAQQFTLKTAHNFQQAANQAGSTVQQTSRTVGAGLEKAAKEAASFAASTSENVRAQMFSSTESTWGPFEKFSALKDLGQFSHLAFGQMLAEVTYEVVKHRGELTDEDRRTIILKVMRKVPFFQRVDRDLMREEQFNGPSLEKYFALPLSLQVEPGRPDFNYQDLQGDPHIRLLRILPAEKSGDGRDQNAHTINCELQNFSRSEAPQYTCLSYTWGSQATLYPILVNGKKSEIGTTLATFLVQALCESSSSPWYWIDALCINQGSKEDKDKFVPRMSEIYPEAEKVVIFLGAGNDSFEGTLRTFDDVVQGELAKGNFEKVDLEQPEMPINIE